MAAGIYRHRVAIQTRTATLQGDGSTVFTWATAATVWAQVEPTGGRERELVGKIAAVGNYIIRMRYGHTISEKSRILWGTRIFNILNITNKQERDVVIELACEEVKT